MISPLAVMAVVILIASMHMIAPDHWMPLAALTLKKKYSDSKVRALSAYIGMAHGVSSVILSLAILYIGIAFIGSKYIRVASVIILVLVSLYILINSIRESREAREIEETSLLVSAFPDPAFLPMAIIAYTYGTYFVISTGLIYVAASTIALLAVVFLVNIGLLRKLSSLKPVTVDRIVVVVLLLTAAYIYFFG
ncbi:TVG0944469 [Thermoplasma volcanium GSS1]|uniref:TVG0944469 protein n=1 Tax=Thermoplasma volcanium (strain ATCC 51530 / DSM 4299 / JCM 9571 / NBRC 15438 / GSS1) TaxID=273116 RepID=Q97A93_THEVO|nr:hypothetical protein [Thermoplasma volcanium]BAB60059.1 TVG0944469 [Thermoplasma volcanium GSS1]